MKHVLALVSGFGWHVQDLRRAAEALDVGFEAVPFPSVTGFVGGKSSRITAGGLDATLSDGVLVRMMPPGTLEQVVFRMDTLHRLAAAGVPVLNPPGAIEAAVDKYLATARLAAAGLHIPPTWAGESASEALDVFEQLGRDVVVKPLFGSEGRGIVRVTDVEIARRVFFTIERLGSVLYVQKFLPNDGSDLRLLVLDGRVLGAIRRRGTAGEWRANVALGGRFEAVRPDAETEAIALRAARAVGARLAGVDLLHDREGCPHVIEVNAVPGWKALGAATGIDVAAEILTALRDHRP